MTNIETLCYFLGITKKTWYNWKDEERLITKFIEKYLPYDNIKEFINTNTIKDFEYINLLNPIALEQYSIYTTRLMNSSFPNYCQNYGTEENMQTYLYTEIPIFTFFEYINNYPYNKEDSYDSFGSDILSILLKHNVANINMHTNSIHELFMITPSLCDIFNMFIKEKSFDIYYNYSQGNDKNLHAFFNMIYFKIKKIQSLNLPKRETNLLLLEMINNNKYNEKTYYVNEVKDLCLNS